MSSEQEDLLKTIDRCYQALRGGPLPCPAGLRNRYAWLHAEAPYSLLAHRASADPVFVYANQMALHCFKYTEAEMLCLPSRLSAAEADRADRARFLETVTRDGIAYNYAGLRVDKQGNSFPIYDGIIWQLREADGTNWGQAALFWPHDESRPDWYY